MKILILTASTGGGHKRAAAAIKAKINSLNPNDEVTVIDGMEALGKVYNTTVTKGYHIMATVVPEIYGKLYRLTDENEPLAKALIKSNEMYATKLLEVIEERNPDIIIICHPFITNMVSRLKETGKLKTKAISLITDYNSHRSYISEYIEAFVVAEPQMIDKLKNEYGVAEERIFPLGIPVFDRFIKNDTKENLRRRERLDPDIPTVLLMAGSFGVTDVLEFYEQLAQTDEKIQMIVITGRNIHLFDNLDKKIQEIGSAHTTKLLYFVDNVEDYMHMADLIVTKPGGLTVTESINCGLPMAIYSAYPGQEEDNVDFLLEQKAAVLIDTENGAEQIISLLRDKEKLNEMRESCKRLAMPNAAEDIYKLAKKFCETDDGDTEDAEKAEDSGNTEDTEKTEDTVNTEESGED